MWKFVWGENVGNDVVRRNAIFIYLTKFLNFRTHFGGTSQNENKIGKNNVSINIEDNLHNSEVDEK